MLYLAGHNRALDTFALEEANQLAELANADPDNAIRDPLDFRIGLLANCGYGKRDAGSPRSLEHEKRKAAITGNETVLHRV